MRGSQQKVTTNLSSQSSSPRTRKTATLLPRIGLIGAVLVAGFIAGFALAPDAAADTRYYQHTFFDNSLMPGSYFYSSATPSAPSTLEVIGKKLPVETETFLTPPNALRLAWSSQAGGGWDAAIDVVEFRNRQIRFDGDTLYIWVYSPTAIAAADLPLVRLEDVGRNFTAALPLGDFSGSIPAAKWLQIKVPLNKFRTASLHEFHAQTLRRIVFLQGKADGVKHTLILDEIRIDSGVAALRSPSFARSALAIPAARTAPSGRENGAAYLYVPRHLTGSVYERHVDLRWNPPVGKAAASVERYIIYRSGSRSDSRFFPVGTQVRGITRFTDYLGSTAEPLFTAS